jgi:hypothetical protein
MNALDITHIAGGTLAILSGSVAGAARQQKMMPPSLIGSPILKALLLGQPLAARSKV